MTRFICLYPIDVQFSSAGLLVFDYGEMQVNVLDPASGALRRKLGGRGAGPGEFNGPVQFFGTWAQPGFHRVRPEAAHNQ